MLCVSQRMGTLRHCVIAPSRTTLNALGRGDKNLSKPIFTYLAESVRISTDAYGLSYPKMGILVADIPPIPKLVRRVSEPT